MAARKFRGMRASSLAALHDMINAHTDCDPHSGSRCPSRRQNIFINLLHLVHRWCSNCAHHHFGAQIFLQTSLNRKKVAKLICANLENPKRVSAAVASIPLCSNKKKEFHSSPLSVAGSRVKNSVVRSSSRRLDSSCHFGRVGYVVSINS